MSAVAASRRVRASRPTGWAARLLWGVLACLVLATGCQSNVRIDVKSIPETNGGKPLYLMVRKVDSNAFLEKYDQVAERLFTFPRDETVLHRESIFPGKDRQFTLEGIEDSDIAIYVFYTDPLENRWRRQVRQPIPSDIVVELGERGIKDIIVIGE